jgi:hypothetical protein
MYGVRRAANLFITRSYFLSRNTLRLIPFVNCPTSISTEGGELRFALRICTQLQDQKLEELGIKRKSKSKNRSITGHVSPASGLGSREEDSERPVPR